MPAASHGEKYPRPAQRLARVADQGESTARVPQASARVGAQPDAARTSLQAIRRPGSRQKPTAGAAARKECQLLKKDVSRLRQLALRRREPFLESERAV